MEGEAFRYDPANNYDSHPQLHIGQMTDVCSYCDALKWPGEAPDMCCSGDAIANDGNADNLGKLVIQSWYPGGN
ncbi:unnamed protein product [Didymodactylos carnosus]|uniref:Uncharacterized protein n=1 Tax=Didymodactylos carnosus TaxID=1234261 RepID=A0A815UIH5_9BILA|nr:unnamed protein product [Didymodactylos carnosus]CAF4379238.1 unnamed protein product [Didymodactylos carnosus]